VENAVVSFAPVLEASVVPSPDEKWGERPVVYLTLKNPSAPFDSSQLLAHLRKRLAGYKVPDRVEVVRELPKTSTGKVQKYVLREREWVKAGKSLSGKRIN
jgi:fatty-acyl-CoA synthase